MSVLQNKSFKEYSYTSRYSPFPYYYHTVDKKYIYGITAYLDDSTPFRMHKVSSGETFDSLALKYYDNPTYYWVICSFNHIRDPYQKLIEGSLIKIPTLSNIQYSTGRE